ncbi:hypothetical protein AB205_0090090 [Aquarana catesbeiana]|uniref:Uncharacterized protein n=1 Tax=Aquarana catesbeiana TaxID=8400 RepID=A0A2G9S484_AQUCT|nr:hypothetical protein AB205_0090090 [Aquarana catesbeiana]PIO34920.1 hypothetical protein AB205_0090090 [Aquarana catesbeiana]
MFITFVLLHVLFLTVVQFKMATFMFMGTLFVRIKHCSFGLENTIVLAICHMHLPTFFMAYLSENNLVV